MGILTVREALNEAMCEEMERDASIFLMGEEVAEYNGAYKVSKGMLDKFGPERVIDSPISEGGFSGLGVGAAMTGLRPIIEVMTWNFGIQSLDQIVNHAAKLNFMSGGQFNIPIVFRGPNGPAHMLGAQHSQSLEPMLTNVPGLKVVSISTPSDAKGLLKSAIRDNNPVMFLESETMYGLKGEVPEGEHIIPLGVGEIKRSGQDVTVITWGRIYHKVAAAAEKLAAEGIDVEILDPRTLQPLDEDMIFASVRKTNRCVIVEESWPFSSVGSQISDRVQNECFDDLDAPVERVAQLFTPVPYSEALEHEALPSEERIIAGIKKACYKK
jgi:pyruvate dehydrogenase E1 component beta subunit